MISELRLETLKLEGDIFKLNRMMDKEHRIDRYRKLQESLNQKKIQHEQYLSILCEFDKQEKIKQIKRRMMR